MINSLGYIGEFEVLDDHRSGKIVVQLTGRINKCGVISPRFDVQTTVSLISYVEFLPWITTVLLLRHHRELVCAIDRLDIRFDTAAVSSFAIFVIITSTPLQDIEQWVQNVLPARGFGHIVLTTTFGIMDHEEARRKKTGGKILGFFY